MFYNMITGKNSSNILTKQKNVHASAKNIIYVKNIIFGILLHVVVKMENI